jgi:hypothetical protein
MSTQDSPGSAAWWRRRYAERAGRRPRPGGLTLEAITDAALEIADRDGLEALTMRRLADRMGVRHTSLYRHVASREELLVELADRVLAEVELPPEDPDWQAAVPASCAGCCAATRRWHRCSSPASCSAPMPCGPVSTGWGC